MNDRDLSKAALYGEPSYIWREGQERHLKMMIDSAGERIDGSILENGCGVGMYIEKLEKFAGVAIGLEYDFERSVSAHERSKNIIDGANEYLPFAEKTFDLIVSHEVIEHVTDDQKALDEMARVLKPGGRLVLFCPNKGYPFETHGIYWRGNYRFGNVPLVNYLPTKLRDKLAPHVRVYTSKSLENLFEDLDVHILSKKIIFGAYDNIIARFPFFGRIIRRVLHFFESTPLKVFGLSHYWVIQKNGQ